MGQLVDGVWHDEWYDTESTGGRFQRTTTAWRNWVTPDGSPGPSLYCAVVVKQVDERTRSKTSINELLRA